jgi:hypothetical protein
VEISSTNTLVLAALRRIIEVTPDKFIAALEQSEINMILPGLSIMATDGRLVWLPHEDGINPLSPAALAEARRLIATPLTAEKAASRITCSPEELVKKWLYWVEIILARVTDVTGQPLPPGQIST